VGGASVRRFRKTVHRAAATKPWSYMESEDHPSAPFLASRSLLWAHSVRPYDRLQDRANLERGTRWSKSSG